MFLGVRTFVGEPIYTAEILERPIILQPKTGICAQRRSTAYREISLSPLEGSIELCISAQPEVTVNFNLGSWQETVEDVRSGNDSGRIYRLRRLRGDSFKACRPAEAR